MPNVEICQGRGVGGHVSKSGDVWRCLCEWSVPGVSPFYDKHQARGPSRPPSTSLFCPRPLSALPPPAFSGLVNHDTPPAAQRRVRQRQPSRARRPASLALRTCPLPIFPDARRRRRRRGRFADAHITFSFLFQHRGVPHRPPSSSGTQSTTDIVPPFVMPVEPSIPPPPPPQDQFIADQDAADSGADDDDDSDKAKGEKKAGRRKIKIEFIQDKSRRHITFSKRKAGQCSASFTVPDMFPSLLIAVARSRFRFCRYYEKGQYFSHFSSRFVPSYVLLSLRPRPTNSLPSPVPKCSCSSSPRPVWCTRSPLLSSSRSSRSQRARTSSKHVLTLLTVSFRPLCPSGSPSDVPHPWVAPITATSPVVSPSVQARTTVTTVRAKAGPRISADVGHLPRVVATRAATTHPPAPSTLHNPRIVQLSRALRRSPSLKGVRIQAHPSRSLPCPSVLRLHLLHHPRPRRLLTTLTPVRALRTILRLARTCIPDSRAGSWRRHKGHQQASIRRSTLLDREPRQGIGLTERAQSRAGATGGGKGGR